jgi:hypothetical protein
MGATHASVRSVLIAGAAVIGLGMLAASQTAAPPALLRVEAPHAQIAAQQSS